MTFENHLEEIFDALNYLYIYLLNYLLNHFCFYHMCYCFLMIIDLYVYSFYYDLNKNGMSLLIQHLNSLLSMHLMCNMNQFFYYIYDDDYVLNDDDVNCFDDLIYDDYDDDDYNDDYNACMI